MEISFALNISENLNVPYANDFNCIYVSKFRFPKSITPFSSRDWKLNIAFLLCLVIPVPDSK